MHTESGFLRLKPGGAVEFVVAQATGMAEVSRGALEGGVLRLGSTAVAGAEKVLEVTREYTLRGEGSRELGVVVGMRTHTQPLQPHLRATLHKA